MSVFQSELALTLRWVQAYSMAVRRAWNLGGGEPGAHLAFFMPLLTVSSFPDTLTFEVSADISSCDFGCDEVRSQF